MKVGDQVFRAVLDIGATLSIVDRRLLKTFKKTKTVAIKVGDGRTIYSLGGVDVTICCRNIDPTLQSAGVSAASPICSDFQTFCPDWLYFGHFLCFGGIAASQLSLRIRPIYF